MRDTPKMRAAYYATTFIRDGIVLGLGSGTTVKAFVEILASKVAKDNLEIIVIPSSSDIEILALKKGLKIASLNEYPEPELAIDGADIVLNDKTLIKGRGGALTREKIIDYNSKEYYIIVDYTKTIPPLHLTIPVEVIPFAWKNVKRKLNSYGCASLRMCSGGKLGPIITDNGNFIIDISLNVGANLGELEKEIKQIPGVVENGIFALKKPKKIIVGEKEGGITLL